MTALQGFLKRLNKSQSTPSKTIASPQSGEEKKQTRDEIQVIQVVNIDPTKLMETLEQAYGSGFKIQVRFHGHKPRCTLILGGR